MEKPSFSKRSISLDIKVSDIRGYPFKIIPKTGGLFSFTRLISLLGQAGWKEVEIPIYRGT